VSGVPIGFDSGEVPQALSANAATNPNVMIFACINM
jgi:hypothetical protein